MLVAYSTGQPPTRGLKPAAYPSQEWITERVQLHIQGSE